MLFMALACFSFAFVACGGDDDDKGNGGQDTSSEQKDQTGLVGTWNGPFTEKGETYMVTICFKANYTGWDDWGGDKGQFTWYTEGEKLVFVYPDGEKSDYDIEEYIYKVAGNQLYLYWFDSRTGEKELDCVLTRQ